MWQKSIEHCERLDWSKMTGNLSVDEIPPIIISLGESENKFASDLDSSDEVIMIEDSDESQ